MIYSLYVIAITVLVYTYKENTMEPFVVDKEDIYFHPEQLRNFCRIFPVVVQDYNTSYEAMLCYNGQQSV